MFYFKVFGRKFYILKDVRKGNLDAKSYEGIFLGYSNKSKTYTCLNLSTHKVIESAHVKIDEFVERSEEKSSKEPKEYRNFFFYEEELETLPQIVEAKKK